MITLRRLSSKALRAAGRFLAIQQLGGSIVDTPGEFFAGLEARGVGRKEGEDQLLRTTDELVARMTNDPGFFGSKNVLNILEWVKKKLGRSFERGYKDRGAHLPRRKLDLHPAQRKREIGALLKWLRKEKDQEVKKKIRRKLRRLGHEGGLRTV